MKQVMIEALSTRIEELSKALEKLQQRDDIQIAHMRSAFSDGSRSAVTADAPVSDNIDDNIPFLYSVYHIII